ncbi:TPA: LPXTG cell wall anchor domain-containing protein [Candidatus Ventrenecus stercoripullorum]|nr:LPXTG cell wall anchor domain-containing protein [Candidatus Ventrenecus stercoripullorum]
MERVLNKWGLKLIFAISLLFITTSVNAASLKVGEKEFEDFLEAVDEANTSGNPIVLQNDYSYGASSEEEYESDIDIEKKVSIDLNNFTFSIGKITNSSELEIYNGILKADYKSVLSNNVITNEENATLTLRNVKTKLSNQAKRLLNNEGIATLNNVTLQSSSATNAVENSATGTVTLENCIIELNYQIIMNSGKMTINGGTYKNTDGSTLIRNDGVMTINDGTFETQDFTIGSVINLNAGSTLEINNGNFKGVHGIISNCISTNFTCSGTTKITINNATFNTTANLIETALATTHNTEITINDGNYTTTEDINVFSLSGNGVVTINLYGGTFNAPNASNISGKTDTATATFNIGKDDGTVNQIPNFNIQGGKIDVADETKFNFYDGVIRLKNKISKIDDKPDGYDVCYSEENGYIRAELKTSCDTTVPDNPEEGNSEGDNSSLGEGEVENPQTGSTVNWIALSIFLVLTIALLWIIRKKNVFHRL